MNRATDRTDRLGQLGRDRRAVRVDRQDFGLAGARRAVVLGVAAIGGLPVPGSGAVEGDRVGIGHDAVRHGLGARSDCSGGAGVVGVDGVGHRSAGVRRGARERGAVMDRAADGAYRLGQLGRDRRAVLGDDDGFLAATRAGGVVVLVARVGGRPLIGAHCGSREARRSRCGDAAQGHYLGVDRGRVAGPSGGAIQLECDRAGRAVGTGQSRGVVQDRSDQSPGARNSAQGRAGLLARRHVQVVRGAVAVHVVEVIARQDDDRGAMRLRRGARRPGVAERGAERVVVVGRVVHAVDRHGHFVRVSGAVVAQADLERRGAADAGERRTRDVALGDARNGR